MCDIDIIGATSIPRVVIWIRLAGNLLIMLMDGWWREYTDESIVNLGWFLQRISAKNQLDFVFLLPLLVARAEDHPPEYDQKIDDR